MCLLLTGPAGMVYLLASFLYPSLCGIKRPVRLCEVHIDFFSFCNRALQLLGRHCSTELRLALSACPLTPSVPEKPWRCVPVTQNGRGVRKPLQPERKEDKHPRHWISDPWATHTSCPGCSLRGEFPSSFSQPGEKGKPRPQSHDCRGSGVTPLHLAARKSLFSSVMDNS